VAPVRGAYVAVADDPPAPDPARPTHESRAEANATRRYLHDASRRAVVAALPLPGALLLAIWPLALWAFAAHAVAAGPLPWLWGTLAAPLALAQIALPRYGRGLPRRLWRAWPALPLASAALLALLPWLVQPPWAGPLSFAALAWSVAAAAALAPWRRIALAVTVVPAAAGAGVAWSAAADSMLLWALVGLLGAAGAGAVAWMRHRLWQRGERRVLALENRVRGVESERDGALRAGEEKSRFLAIASHDLRQPVHALGLFAATLGKRLQHTPDEALVRNFLRAVDDLERSFSALLDISRLDGAALSPRLTTFALRDLFRRLHMQYAGQAELAGLGLRFAPGGKSVTSDPQLLERVVGNLVQNALKYTRSGGVVVVARSTRTHTHIEVWDTGIGIAPDQLPRIFQEFYQATGRPVRRDRQQGLGMGLAIVRRLVSLLGHRLEVASTPGRGTVFRVGIAVGGLPGIQEETAAADTQPMMVQTPRMVLVVDDEEPIREGLRGLLQEWGYQVMTAANAAEAEQAVLALEGRVDLVLSDVQLDADPRVPDGLAVVDSVRRLCGHAVPAVLVTGQTAPEVASVLAASGHPVLFKPVQPRRLFDTMGSLLG
jgi:signal transduction histidine kinase/CheY-like chemotaxis protein